MNTITLPPIKKAFARVESIDLLRGLIMIVMALDHVRDYFHRDAFLYDPTDLSKTTALIFLTRFITHYCAPTFMFLSGTSAFLVGQRKGRKALSIFLLTRGLWLVTLELTVVNFGWYFNFPPPSIDFLVIWALGISMIALAGLVYLPLPWILGLSLAMIFGHNLLDGIHAHGQGAGAVIWSMIHESNFYQFKGFTSEIGYPVVPWIGVMAIGYCTGKLYAEGFDAHRRQRMLRVTGLIAVLLFVGLRYTNAYGDMQLWSRQSSRSFTLFSFINVTKYPPSLLYLLVTLGPALIFLSFAEKIKGALAEAVKVIGRVPMFYYLVHIYLIHLGALVATNFCGHSPTDMVLNNWVAFEPKLKGYGFSLGVVYIAWICLVVMMYFMCRWYDRYKKGHRHWWLSYL